MLHAVQVNALKNIHFKQDKQVDIVYFFILVRTIDLLMTIVQQREWKVCYFCYC